MNKEKPQRILVAIANHGVKNQSYLKKLISTYETFHDDVDIFVLSDIDKDLGPEIKVKVGAPSENPWSLPFAYKALFDERQDDYDLFIYSEDDTLITQVHVDAFLEVDAHLPSNKIAGFWRHEIARDGAWHYSTAHGSYHWDPKSIFMAGGEVFAHYTNEHAAAFILTRDKLKACIGTGLFLCPPYEGRYDMLCTAATDPYTIGGLKKVICISRLEQFSLHHLPDKYIGKIGLPKVEMDVQIDQMLQMASKGESGKSLLEGRTKLKGSGRYDRSYFTPEVPSVVAAMPDDAHRVLSVGCDIGRIEHALLHAGHKVEAVTLDAIVASSARTQGIDVLEVDPEAPSSGLESNAYDALLMNFCLPYVPDPYAFLNSFRSVLKSGGRIVIPFWNWQCVGELRRRRTEAKRSAEMKTVGDYALSGIHRTDIGIVRNWLEAAGQGLEYCVFDVPSAHESWSRLSLGTTDRWTSQTGTAVSRPRSD